MPCPRKPNLSQLSRNARRCRKLAQAPRTSTTFESLTGSPESAPPTTNIPMLKIPPELIKVEPEVTYFLEDSTRTPTMRKMDSNSSNCTSKMEKIQQPPTDPFSENIFVRWEETEHASAPSPFHTNEAPLPDCVNSYKDALLLLKALEDFALIKENFRAIGLFTQLEKIFEAGEKAAEMESSAK